MRTGELFKRGRRLKLAGQPLQILTLLLERPGDLVTREELCSRLWPDETYVDFDRGLNTAVRTLRRTLGDSPRKPGFIETLPKRGYRFVASVEAVETSTANGPNSDSESSEGLSHRTSRGRTLWAVAAVIGFVGLGLFAVRSVSGPPPAARAEEMVAGLPRGLSRVWGALSPDGRYLARRDGDSGFLYLHELDGGEMTLLVAGPVERGMIWSPDSREVAYLRDRDGEKWVERVEVSSGEIVPLLNTGPAQALPDVKVPVAWDATGNRLLLCDWRGNWLGFLSLDSSDVEEIKLPDELVERTLSLSPNGRFLASSTAGDLVVLEVTGDGTPTASISADAEQSHPVWSRDGATLLFTRTVGEHRGNPEVWAVKIDPEEGTLKGDPARVAEVARPRLGVLPIVADDGSYLWAKQDPPNHLHVVEVNPETGEPVDAEPTELPSGHWGGYWSAGGSLLRVETNLDWGVPGKHVFREINTATDEEKLVELNRIPGRGLYNADLTAAAVVRNGGSTLFHFDVERRELTEVAASDERFFGATLSRDQRRIAFFETAFLIGEAGTIGIADVAAKSVRRLYDGEHMEPPVWSPDDAEIAFVDKPCIYVLDVESGDAQQLTCYPTLPPELDGIRTASPQWSADGSMLVWGALDQEERRNEIWAIDRATGDHRVIWRGEPDFLTQAWSPRWSADGRFLAYTMMDSPPVEIWRIRHPIIGGEAANVSD